MIEVELHPAFAWDCDECGRQNFVCAIMPPYRSLIEENLVYHALDIEPDEGFPVMAPCIVTCAHCKTEFKTDVKQIYGDPEEEEEEDGS